MDDVGSVIHADGKLNVRSQQPPKVGGLGISTSPRTLLQRKMHRACITAQEVAIGCEHCSVVQASAGRSRNADVAEAGQSA
jgi:hypothetical protein